MLSDRVPEKENILLHKSCSPVTKGPDAACVQPISPSVRNLSDTLCSSKTLFGVSAPSASPALGPEIDLGVSVHGAPRVDDPAPGEKVDLGVSVNGAPMVDDEEVEEGRAPRTRECPEGMTPEALRIHSLTHIPYHPGCACCVAGRERDHKHPRRAFDIDKMQADLDTANGASLCADYFFPRDLICEEIDGIGTVRLHVAVLGRPRSGLKGCQCRTHRPSVA
jgi:hypothetical protein